jgi:hypothetical protein
MQTIGAFSIIGASAASSLRQRKQRTGGGSSNGSTYSRGWTLISGAGSDFFTGVDQQIYALGTPDVPYFLTSFPLSSSLYGTLASMPSIPTSP